MEFLHKRMKIAESDRERLVEEKWVQNSDGEGYERNKQALRCATVLVVHAMSARSIYLGLRILINPAHFLMKVETWACLVVLLTRLIIIR